jgi:hypothetical protein
LHILTTYFIHQNDWQRVGVTHADEGARWEFMNGFAESVSRAGVKTTVVHDGLPSDFVRKHRSEFIEFREVNPDEYQRDGIRYGVNDVRFLIFADLVKENPKWKYIFNTDIADVRFTGKLTCGALQEDTLYVGSESEPNMEWMQLRFDKMGGRYAEWWRNEGRDQEVLNCGVIGGSRKVISNLYKHISRAIQDPHLNATESREEVNVNMPALNYAARHAKSYRIVTGAPVHSHFGRQETTRSDVWFIHKLL